MLDLPGVEEEKPGGLLHGGESARWQRACGIALVGPAWMLDLPGVEEEEPDGPLRGVVPASDKPVGSRQ